MTEQQNPEPYGRESGEPFPPDVLCNLDAAHKSGERRHHHENRESLMAVKKSDLYASLWRSCDNLFSAIGDRMNYGNVIDPRFYRDIGRSTMLYEESVIVLR
jgi:hypothetical protein